MLNSRLRRLLRLQRLSAGLAGLAFGGLMSIVANLLSEDWGRWLPAILTVTIILAAASLYLYIRERPGSKVVIRAPRTIRTSEDAQRYARRGYVGFVPLFRPLRHSKANQLEADARRAAVNSLDFAALDLENSNMQPTITAISTHTSRLEHCWLLSTSCADETAPGSESYPRLLAEYLRREKGLTCRFYYGDAYCISLDDDALVLNKTYDEVLRVFAQSERLGLSAQEIIADITTGTRSMMLGIVLACLDQEHDVEFIGTRYRDDGQPIGKLLPIIFSVEAQPEP